MSQSSVTVGTALSWMKPANRVVAIFVIWPLFQIFKKNPKNIQIFLNPPLKIKKSRIRQNVKFDFFHSVKITDLIFIFPEGWIFPSQPLQEGIWKVEYSKSKKVK